MNIKVTIYSKKLLLGGFVINRIKRLFSILLVATLMFNITPQKVFAISGDINNRKILFAEKYAGIDLVSKDFDRTKMSRVELVAYDELLELMYLENKNVADQEGYSKGEYIQIAENILSENSILKKSVISEYSYYSTFRAARTSNVLISTKLLGGILNGVITATLLVTGAASVGELIKKMGKEATKDWIEKHVKKAIANKLAAIGLGSFGVYAANIIQGIVDAYLDPGGWLAERIDAADKIPNNGYIELW